MWLQFYVLSILLTTLCAFQSCNGSITPSPQLSLPNSILIFNSIHSSMRQYGESLFHNGMTIYAARVPKGTRLYHGNGNNTTVKGTEWLAFEPEHAAMFAHMRRPGRGPGRGPGGKPGSPPPPPSTHGVEQTPLIHDLETFFPEASPGWIHTYAAKKDLHLLYIDGMSAGKTSNGTLDTQDFLIRNLTAPPPGFGDFERAKSLCMQSKEVWQGRIDGAIRMEGGFEIILCDFEDGLDELFIARARGTNNRSQPDSHVNDQFSYLRAVADRYHGIGGHRVQLNYDTFFTAFSYGFDLFNGQRMPRLEHLSTQNLKVLRSGLDRFILNDPNPFTAISTDWQAVADLIVVRFASRIKYLMFPDMHDSYEPLKDELYRILMPFIDYDQRDAKQETERCTYHFIPQDTSDTIAKQSIIQVSHYLCKELVESLHTLSDCSQEKCGQSVIEVRHRLQQLINNLNWTTWKDCGPCDYNEVCYIPIWPLGGTQDDWDNPKCRNATEASSRNGYWGSFPGPGRNFTAEDLIYHPNIQELQV